MTDTHNHNNAKAPLPDELQDKLFDGLGRQAADMTLMLTLIEIVIPQEPRLKKRFVTKLDLLRDLRKSFDGLIVALTAEDKANETNARDIA